MVRTGGALFGTEAPILGNLGFSKHCLRIMRTPSGKDLHLLYRCLHVHTSGLPRNEEVLLLPVEEIPIFVVDTEIGGVVWDEERKEGEFFLEFSEPHLYHWLHILPVDLPLPAFQTREVLIVEKQLVFTFMADS